MSRTDTRERTARANQFVPVNMLEIPPGLVAYYKAQGQHLRWVRFLANGKDDIRNLTKRQREGYVFIPRSELPEEFKDDFDEGREGRSEGLVINGDVVLARIPVEKARARKEYYENAHNMQEEQLDAQLLQHSSRAMPIENRSKTRTTTGRKPAIGAISEEG